MRLAIADPPYLGRAARHYGPGADTTQKFGSGAARADRGRKPSRHGTTVHPDAGVWDDPATHVALVRQLQASYDGWAIAAWPTSLRTYLAACPPDVRVAIWVKGRAVPGGNRIITSWEPVITYVPPSRRGRGTGPSMRDVVLANVMQSRHVGAKPVEWTRFVLDLLGYDQDTDEVVDLFPGSGIVSAAIAQGVLDLDRRAPNVIVVPVGLDRLDLGMDVDHAG